MWPLKKSGIQPTKTTLAWLDTVVATSEIWLNDMKIEVHRAEELMHAEEDKIRHKLVEGREKKFILQEIKRFRVRLSALEHRMDILDRNISVGSSLIDKVRDIEAMALQGVKIDQIDNVVQEFEAKMDQFMSVSETEVPPTDEVQSDNSLEQLEAEILGIPDKEDLTQVRTRTSDSTYIRPDKDIHIDHYNPFKEPMTE